MVKNTLKLFLFGLNAVSINIYHFTNLVIQSQFWASSARTFKETFPQNRHRTDDQRSVSTILKECLGQLPGPNRRKPTERDVIGPVRHHRRESASPALPHLRIRILFIFVSPKIGDQFVFERLKASDQTVAQLSHPVPPRRNGLSTTAA